MAASAVEREPVNHHGAKVELYDGVDDAARGAEGGSSSSADDEEDMRRLGKKQLFQRNFQLVTIIAFTVVTMSGFVFVPSTLTYGLYNGGTGGVFAMYMLEFFGLFLVVLCLAEMSSMMPTAGGQYHWASELAPRRFQKMISYYSGWLASLAWLSGVTGGMYPAGFILQGLILLANPSYDPKAWQCYLFVVMIAGASLLVNTLLARYLPAFESFVLVLFGVSFVVFIIVMWALPAHLTAAEVFSSFQTGNGWDSLGLNMLTGQSNLLFLIVGADSTAHMAEETRHASLVVPKAMVASYLINGFAAMVFIITYCFCLVDYTAVENSAEGLLGLPQIQVFANVTSSIRGGQALAALLAILQIFESINYMVTCSRQIFAFARDRGLPFGSWISKVHRSGTAPVNAVLVVFGFVVLLTLIALGSTTAFTAITSLTLLALFSTYTISLACLLWRRCFGGGIVPGPWNLGQAGIVINAVALTYCAFVIVFLPWPVERPVTAANMNWSSTIFAGIMIIATLYYVFRASKSYVGPVVYIKSYNE